MLALFGTGVLSLEAAWLLLDEFSLLARAVVILYPDSLSRFLRALSSAARAVARGSNLFRLIHAFSGSLSAHLAELLLTGLRDVAELASPSLVTGTGTLLALSAFTVDALAAESVNCFLEVIAPVDLTLAHSGSFNIPL